MTVKEQIKKIYTFVSRSVAVDCATQDIANPLVESVEFVNKTWIKEGEEDKYEVRTTFIKTTS